MFCYEAAGHRRRSRLKRDSILPTGVFCGLKRPEAADGRRPSKKIVKQGIKAHDVLIN